LATTAKRSGISAEHRLQLKALQLLGNYVFLLLEITESNSVMIKSGLSALLEQVKPTRRPFTKATLSLYARNNIVRIFNGIFIILNKKILFPCINAFIPIENLVTLTVL
jgi:hypothetical protein